MTLRIEAGDSAIGRMRARLREPTGSPVVEIALDDLPEDLARALVQSVMARVCEAGSAASSRRRRGSVIGDPSCRRDAAAVSQALGRA